MKRLNHMHEDHFLTIFFTCLVAYGLSAEQLKFKKFYSVVLLICMYFSGGLIPQFFVIKHVGIYNTRWANFIPYLISTYNVIIMRSFFASLPESLEEAALIDGATRNDVFFKIILPQAVRYILPAIGKGVTQNTNGVNFRKAATVASDSMGLLKAGVKVAILEIPDEINTSSFFKVRYDGKVGYIRKTCLSY